MALNLRSHRHAHRHWDKPLCSLPSKSDILYARVTPTRPAASPWL